MNRRALVFCLIAAVVAVFWVKFRPPGKVEVEQFSWQLDDTKVSYSFSVVNSTGESVRPLIVLVAETRQEGREGPKILPRGSARMELELAPASSRKVSGSFVLNQSGDAHLVVYPQLTMPESR